MNGLGQGACASVADPVKARRRMDREMHHDPEPGRSENEPSIRHVAGFLVIASAVTKRWRGREHHGNGGNGIVSDNKA